VKNSITLNLEAQSPIDKLPNMLEEKLEP